MSLGLLNINKAVYGGTEFELDENQSATAVSISAAYDFENDSKITPFIEGSYSIAWSDDIEGSASGYGINFGLSTPIADKVELWGAVSLGLSSEESVNIDGTLVKSDGGTEWGFLTGLRIRL